MIIYLHKPSTDSKVSRCRGKPKEIKANLDIYLYFSSSSASKQSEYFGALWLGSSSWTKPTSLDLNVTEETPVFTGYMHVVSGQTFPGILFRFKPSLSFPSCFPVSHHFLRGQFKYSHTGHITVYLTVEMLMCFRC